MKRFTKTLEIFALLIFCVGVVNAQKAAAPAAHEKDEAAIKANIEGMRTGWNAKSGEAFTKAFTEDADAVVITGLHIKTRAEIARQHQRLFDTIFKDVDILEYQVEQIRFLRPDVALVHALGRRTLETDKTKSISGSISLVMLKNKGTWQITAFHNTAIQDQR
jgi:uncharacterized protein (TIGR02246 family)